MFFMQIKKHTGITDVNYASFSESNLQVGDSVNCIYYCPRFPDYANEFDFYLYMQPVDTIKVINQINSLKDNFINKN